MRIVLIVCFCFLSFLNFAQIDSKDIGNFKSLKQSDSTIKIITENAEVSISTYESTVIRVNITMLGAVVKTTSYVVQPRKPIPFKSVRELPKSVILATDSMTISVSKFPVRINFYRKGGEFLSGDHVQYGVSWINGKIYNYRLLGYNERIIGMGGESGDLDRSGSVYNLWNSDIQNAKNEETSSVSVPFYIGLYNNHAYGLYLDNTSQSLFDFGASNSRKFLSIEAQNGILNYYFFGASDVKQIMADYTQLTGKAKLPPIWALGYQSGLPNQNQQQILTWLEKRKKLYIPMDVLMLKNADEQESEPFDWDANLYAQPIQMIDSLKAHGLHVVAQVNPQLSAKSKQIYKEAIAKKHVATYPLGDVFYTQNNHNEQVVLPDFMRSEVREWWGNQFKNYTLMGVEGFINSNNEPSVLGQHIPDRIQFGKRSYINIKNIYGLQMAKANAQYWQKQFPNKRDYVMSRAGFSGLQQYGGVWLNPVSVSDESMLRMLRKIQSLGVSGMPMVGVNIAGKGGEITSDLFLRWHSIAVFSPLMVFNPENQSIDQVLEQGLSNSHTIFKKDVEFRYRLLPYLYAQWYQSISNDLPLVKSLAIEYPWDDYVFKKEFQDQFVCGSDFLVCPVASNQSVSQVYLPEGNWYKLSTDSLYVGKNSYQVQAPLHNLPVYVKEGAIVPMQNVVKNTQDVGDGILQLHIWKGRNQSSTVYYEDDGISNDYLKNQYFKRKISVDFEQKKLTLGKVEGEGVSKYKKIEVILHGFTLPKDSKPTTRINQSGMASYTTYQMLENTKEMQEIAL